MKTGILFFLACLFLSLPSHAVQVERARIDNMMLVDSAMTLSVQPGAATVTIEVCAAMKGLRDCRGENDRHWVLSMFTADGGRHDITIGWGNTDHGNFSDTRYLSVRGTGAEPARFSSAVNVYGGDNTLVVDIDGNCKARVYVGSDYMNYAGEILLPSMPDRFKLSSAGQLEVAFMCVESSYPQNLDSGLDEKALMEACASGQPAPLGAWHYLDRDNDAAYARPGGFYDLAVVSDTENPGAFLILYIGGAEVNAGKWKPGMIKGRLIPTMFAGRYNLQWWDAQCEPVAGECHAVIDNSVMTLNFPLLHSQLRYSR